MGSMKNTISEDKFKEACSDDDKKAIEDKVNEVMAWLDTAEMLRRRSLSPCKRTSSLSATQSSPRCTRLVACQKVAWVVACLEVACPMLVAAMAPPLRKWTKSMSQCK